MHRLCIKLGMCTDNMVFKFLFGIHLLQCLHCKNEDESETNKQKKKSYNCTYSSSRCADNIGKALGLKTHFLDFSCLVTSINTQTPLIALHNSLSYLLGEFCLLKYHCISSLLIICFILITYSVHVWSVGDVVRGK